MEDTNRKPWSNFYGYDNFYPGLYTEEEAWKLKGTMDEQLWPLVMDVCFAAGKNNYYIGKVHSNKRSVLLVNKYGWPLLEVISSPNESAYKIHNWYQHLKLRGKDRYTIHSAKRPYLVNAVRPNIEPILRHAEAVMNGTLVRAAQSVNSHLNDVTQSAASISSQIFAPSHAYSALRVLFDPNFNVINIETPVLAKLREYYVDLEAKFAKKKSYKDRIVDMFDHTKWVVMVFPYYGVNYLSIGQVKLTPTTISSSSQYQLNFVVPPTLYRDFNHFYAIHPESEGSLKTALMFCKVHREKDPTSSKAYDPEGFIPCETRGVYEDIGGISYCDGYALASPTTPHILLLQS